MPEALKKSLTELFIKIRHDIKLEQEKEKVQRQLKQPFAFLFDVKQDNSCQKSNEIVQEAHDSEEEKEQELAPKILTTGDQLKEAIQKALCQLEERRERKETRKEKMTRLVNCREYTDRFIGKSREHSNNFLKVEEIDKTNNSNKNKKDQEQSQKDSKAKSGTQGFQPEALVIRNRQPTGDETYYQIENYRQQQRRMQKTKLIEKFRCKQCDMQIKGK